MQLVHGMNLVTCHVQITNNLVQQQLHVSGSCVHTLPMNEPSVIEGTEVTFLDANQYACVSVVDIQELGTVVFCFVWLFIELSSTRSGIDGKPYSLSLEYVYRTC